jgi:hypothetical protein
MLGIEPDFPFSPSALQASLQTSPVQAPNRTIGAAMSLIKKIDVEAHFAARRRTRLAAMGFTRKSAAKVSPAIAPAVVRTNTPAFRNDFPVEPSFSGASTTPSK